jgi:hypothetical protein
MRWFHAAVLSENVWLEKKLYSYLRYF